MTVQKIALKGNYREIIALDSDLRRITQVVNNNADEFVSETYDGDCEKIITPDDGTLFIVIHGLNKKWVDIRVFNSADERIEIDKYKPLDKERVLVDIGGNVGIDGTVRITR
ncbi:hypothetical protein N9104_01775 [Pseudomonadales bacterium]|nr:hypothetical protein [Pseudomonadales bacterium]